MRCVWVLALLAFVPAAVQAGGKPPATQPSIDALLDQLSRVDRKTLEAHLNKLRAEHKKLAAQAAALRKQLQQTEAQVRALERRIKLLEILLKPSGQVPAKPPAVAAKPKAKPKPAQKVAKRAKPAPKPAKASKPAKPAKPAMAAKPRPAPAKPKPAMKPKAAPAKPKLAKAAMKPKPAAGKPAPKAMLANKPATKAKRLNFQDDIQPILVDHCGGCHNQDEARGGLVVDDYELLMAGGSSGEVIVPGDPAGSRLWRMVNHEEQPYMPKDAPKLEAKLLAAIRTWIEQGALPDAKARPASAARPASPQPVASSAVPLVRGPVMPPADLSALRPPTKRAAPVTALAASPTSPVVAVSGHRQVLLLHAGQNRLLAALPFDEGRIERLQFSADGLWLLVAGGLTGKRGVVAIYDVATAKRIATLGRMYDSVLAAAIDPYRELVAAGGSNRVVRVYDLLEGNAVAYEIRKHNEWITAVAFSPDATLLATADRAGALYVWEADTGRLVHVLKHGSAIRAIAFSPNSRLLASTGDDGMVRLWDTDDGRRVRQFRASSQPVLCLDIAPDGRIVAGGQDRRVRLFDASGKALRQFAPADDWVYAVCFAQGGKRIFAGGFSGRVSVYEPDRDQPIASATTNPPRRGKS